jgi:hydrogenase small subunit
MTSFRNISRRDFLKFCAGTASLLGLSEAAVPRVAKALEGAAKKPAVIWLEGQDCAGCTISFINSSNPGTAELVLDTISLRYHETIMAAAGHVAEKALHDTIKEGGYVLIVEGSIPVVDPRFCQIGGVNFIDTVKAAAANAAAVLAIGACAAYGGIPGDCPTPGKGIGVGEAMDKGLVPKKPLINVPTCPVHPERMIGTIVYYLLYKKPPPMDKIGRPLVFYDKLIHDNCERRGHFENGEFLTDWNSFEQRNFCMYLKGCKGPFTYSDCPKRRWSDGLNWCIGCSAVCQGCSEPEFYAGMSPLYDRTKEIRGYKVETIGAVATGVVAVGLAGHFIGQAMTGRLGKGGPPEEGGDN